MSDVAANVSVQKCTKEAFALHLLVRVHVHVAKVLNSTEVG